MPMNITWTFSPGAIIFASRFNTNFSDVKNWADAHEIATTAVHGVGAGTIVGTASINTFTNVNTFTARTSFLNTVELYSPNYISNADLRLSAGSLSLIPENVVLTPSATNPTYIRRVNSGGQWETITINSNTYCVIQDAASADSYFYNGVAGTPWGTTAGVAWAAPMPLFIYMATAALNVNPCLFLSRLPNLKILPAATGIGYANNPPATPAETNVFAWTTNDVTASHAGSPCTFIGFVEATKDTNDDWTFQGATYNTAGILNYNFEFNTYTMPISQNGATAGSYFSVAAGTAPTYTTTNSYLYSFSKDGTINIQFNFINAAGGVAGAGAADLAMSCPITSYTYILGNSNLINGGMSAYGSVGKLSSMINFTGVTGTQFQGADQNNVARSFGGSVIIKI